MNQVSFPKEENNSLYESMPDLKEKIQREKKARQARDRKLRGIRSSLGISEVRPHVDRSEVKAFLKIAVTDKEKAVEILILNSVINSRHEKSMSYELLANLNYGTEISDIKKKERISLVEVIADSVDEMAKLSGSFEAKIYNIFYASDSITVRLLRSLTPKKRWKLLLKILENGKSTSWLVYFARQIIVDHDEKSSKMTNFLPWLDQDQLKTIREVTDRKLRTILRQDFYSSSDPLQFFLFWINIGNEKEKSALREWVRTRTTENSEFVRFVEMFTGRASLYNGSFPLEEIRIGFIDTVGTIINIDKIVSRLQEISKQNDQVGRMSLDLLRTFEYTLSAREQGLRIISCYR